MHSSLLRSVRSLSLGYGIGLIVLCTLIAVSVFSNRAIIVTLVASSASSTLMRDTILFFAPHTGETITVGESVDIDIRINAALPINAVGATVRLDPEILEVVAVSKENSILDLWTEETAINESTGEVHFSGGTLMKGGVSEIATVLTLTVRGKKPGRADLSFSHAEIFAHDGRGEPLVRETRTFTYTVVEPVPVARTESRPTIQSDIETTYVPTGDFNNDGMTSFADVSILAIQLLASYNARFDLDRDGAINLRDLSIIFSRSRQ